MPTVIFQIEKLINICLSYTTYQLLYFCLALFNVVVTYESQTYYYK